MDTNDPKAIDAILADPTHPDYIKIVTELTAQYSQQHSTPQPQREYSGSEEESAPMKQSSSHVVLSPHDRIQALKHHPEFQRCLTVWQGILKKERKGIARTAEEATMYWTPRSGFNIAAEMEASRYQLLSLEERELSTMTEEELAWRDIAPQLDYPNKVAVVHIPLHWTQDAIETIIARIVRVYKNRIGLSDAKYHGPPLEGSDCAPSLRLTELTLRIPLRYPVKRIDTVVASIVRTYRKDLKLTSSQTIRRPEKVDPWEVYRLHHDANLSFINITRQLFDLAPEVTSADDDSVKRLYDQVLDAYQFAEKAIERLGQIYGTLNG